MRPRLRATALLAGVLAGVLLQLAGFIAVAYLVRHQPPPAVRGAGCRVGAAVPATGRAAGRDHRPPGHRGPGRGWAAMTERTPQPIRVSVLTTAAETGAPVPAHLEIPDRQTGGGSDV